MTGSTEDIFNHRYHWELSVYTSISSHSAETSGAGEEMAMHESLPFPAEVVNLQPQHEEDPAPAEATEQPTVEPVEEMKPPETQVKFCI